MFRVSTLNRLRVLNGRLLSDRRGSALPWPGSCASCAPPGGLSAAHETPKCNIGEAASCQLSRQCEVRLREVSPFESCGFLP